MDRPTVYARPTQTHSNEEIKRCFSSPSATANYCLVYGNERPRDYHRGTRGLIDELVPRKYSSNFAVNKGQLNGSSGLYLNNGFRTTHSMKIFE